MGKRMKHSVLDDKIAAFWIYKTNESVSTRKYVTLKPCSPAGGWARWGYGTPEHAPASANEAHLCAGTYIIIAAIDLEIGSPHIVTCAHSCILKTTRWTETGSDSSRVQKLKL